MVIFHCYVSSPVGMGIELSSIYKFYDVNNMMVYIKTSDQSIFIGIYIILYPFLVGGLEHEFYDFPYIGNVNPN